MHLQLIYVHFAINSWVITFEQFYKEFLAENATGFTQFTFKLLDREAYLQNEKVKSALALLSKDAGLRILSLPYQFAFEKKIIESGYRVTDIIGLEGDKESLEKTVYPAANALANKHHGLKIYLLKKTINTQKLINRFDKKIFANIKNGEDKKSANDLRPNLIDLDYVGMYVGERRRELLYYSNLLEPGGLLFVTYSVRPTSNTGLLGVRDLNTPTKNELREIEQAMPSQKLDIEELKTNLSNERNSNIKNTITPNRLFINKITVLKKIIELLEQNKRAHTGTEKIDLTKYTPFAVNTKDKYKSLEVFYKVANSVKNTLSNFELIYANIYRGGQSMSGTGMIRLILQKNNLNEKYNKNILKQHLIYENNSSENAKASWIHGDIKRIILRNWGEFEESNVKYNNIIDDLYAYAEKQNISIEDFVIPYLKGLLVVATKLKETMQRKSNVSADLQQEPEVLADLQQEPAASTADYNNCLKNEYNNYLINLGLMFTSKQREQFALKVEDYINNLSKFKNSFVVRGQNRAVFNNIYNAELKHLVGFQEIEGEITTDFIKKVLEYVAQDKQTYLVYSYGRKANYTQNQFIIKIAAMQVATKEEAQHMQNLFSKNISSHLNGLIFKHEIAEPKYIKTSLGEWIDANNYKEYLSKQDSAMSFDEFAIEAESGDVCNHYDE